MKRFVALIAVSAPIAVPIAARKPSTSRSSPDQARRISALPGDGHLELAVRRLRPRLTGSAGLQRAAEWARDRLATGAWSTPTLERVRIDWPRLGPAALRHRDDGPQFMRLTGYPRAWSPATPSPVTGTPIVVEVRSKADSKIPGQAPRRDRHERTAGAGGYWFQAGSGAPLGRRTEAEGRQARSGARVLAEVVMGGGGGVDKYLADAVDVWKFSPTKASRRSLSRARWPRTCASTASTTRSGTRLTRRSSSPGSTTAASCGCIDKKIPVNISLSVAARFTDNVEGINIVAELPGTDPALKDEVVMLGGHFDSWHSATGATDNGAGRRPRWRRSGS